MLRLKLVIANKNYSSWSMRAWVLLRELGIDFEEVPLEFSPDVSVIGIERYSAVGKVPVLISDGEPVWDSLAICETVAELFPEKRIWPSGKRARQVARSVCAEMHSGFQALREACPFNARARNRKVPMTPELDADVRRIDEMWADCRRLYGRAGRWLFGHYSIADAMYASVVLRFNTYGAKLSPPAREYLDTALADPPLIAWVRAAESDPYRVESIDAVGRT